MSKFLQMHLVQLLHKEIQMENYPQTLRYSLVETLSSHYRGLENHCCSSQPVPILPLF